MRKFVLTLAFTATCLAVFSQSTDFVLAEDSPGVFTITRDFKSPEEFFHYINETPTAIVAAPDSELATASILMSDVQQTRAIVYNEESFPVTEDTDVVIRTVLYIPTGEADEYYDSNYKGCWMRVEKLCVGKTDNTASIASTTR